MKTKLLTLMLLSFLASPSYAGERGGNGGDAVVNSEGARFLDLVRSTEEILDIEPYARDLEDVLYQLRAYQTATYLPLETQTLPVKNKIIASLKSLDFYLVNRPLAETYDRGVVILPFEHQGRIVRLALQGKYSRKVLVNERIFNKLPKLDRLAFFLHEALIRVYLDEAGHLESTERIAGLVKATFKAYAQRRSMTPEILAKYLCDIGISATALEFSGRRKASFDLIASRSVGVERVFYNRHGSCSSLLLKHSGTQTASACAYNTGYYFVNFEDRVISYTIGVEWMGGRTRNNSCAGPLRLYTKIDGAVEDVTELLRTNKIRFY